MEMERINKDTIRVLIDNDDLDARGIRMLDLLGNQKQIESFFYSILEEVDQNHQFQDNEAVTFQVLPNQDGLELFISKATPFSQNDKSDGIDVSDLLKNSESLTAEPASYSTSSEPKNDPYAPTVSTTILTFKSFADFLALSRALEIDNGLANLYRFQDKFFLELRLNTDSDIDMSVSDVVAIASEFAEKTKVTADVLHEHGTLLMAGNALQIGRTQL
ncbi:adaptor protein MecA [Lentilactobacillus senioris]|uniref:adaptor protein MecA n=1 Tax=Lentilactobacillus senioris TaxID=931534 RepID=UPI003D2DA8CC